MAQGTRQRAHRPHGITRLRAAGMGLVRLALRVLPMLLALLALTPARAIVAGAPPDSPASRVDANTSNSAWRGVASVLIGGGTYSGVLVGPRHVLTAAHVARDIGGANPAAITVQFNLSGTAQVLGVARVTVHPSYVGFNTPDLQNDLALLELVADAPSNAYIYSWASAAPAAGTVATLVGYGDSGQGSVGITVTAAASVKRTGRNALDSIITNAQGAATLFYADFDGPTSATNAMGGLTLGNAVESTFAGGDSGCGVFVVTNGTPVLVATGTFTLSFAGGPTTPGVFGTGFGGVLLHSYGPWMRGVIDASGYGSSSSNDAPSLGVIGALPLMLLLAIGVGRARRHERQTARQDR